MKTVVLPVDSIKDIESLIPFSNELGLNVLKDKRIITIGDKTLKIKDINVAIPNIDPEGITMLLSFNNGWELSILKHKYSFGGRDGKWEIAIVGKNGLISDFNPLNIDLIGHLKGSEVGSIIDAMDSWE